MDDDTRFNLYRLLVVAQWPDSAFKKAVVKAIRHRLKCLEIKHFTSPASSGTITLSRAA